MKVYIIKVLELVLFTNSMLNIVTSDRVLRPTIEKTASIVNDLTIDKTYSRSDYDRNKVVMTI